MDQTDLILILLKKRLWELRLFFGRLIWTPSQRVTKEWTRASPWTLVKFDISRTNSNNKVTYIWLSKTARERIPIRKCFPKATIILVSFYVMFVYFQDGWMFFSQNFFVFYNSSLTFFTFRYLLMDAANSFKPDFVESLICIRKCLVI